MDLPLEFPSNAIKSFSLALFNLLNDLNFFISLSFKFGPTPWRSSIPDLRALLLLLSLWKFIANLWASFLNCWINFKVSDFLSIYSGSLSPGLKISSSFFAIPIIDISLSKFNFFKMLKVQMILHQWKRWLIEDWKD